MSEKLPALTTRARLQEIVEEMRAEGSRYKSHDLGYVDSVSANRVDEWADEIAACLAAEGELEPQRKSNGIGLLDTQGWQPIETAPREDEVFFWIVPKIADETYVNTSGQAIISNAAPYLHRGKWKSWGSLSKPTHWMPLPAPPMASPASPEEEPRKPLTHCISCGQDKPACEGC
jgi:hypothetical protein